MPFSSDPSRPLSTNPPGTVISALPRWEKQLPWMAIHDLKAEIFQYVCKKVYAYKDKPWVPLKISIKNTTKWEKKNHLLLKTCKNLW